MYGPAVLRRMAMLEFRHIAVGVDGSPTGDLALRTAIDLTLHYHAQLTIVSVAPIQPVYVAPGEPFVAPSVPTADLPRYRQIVEAAVAAAEKAGVSAVTGVCEDGVVVDELLAFVEKNPTDLLVVGSRGLSAAKRLLLGSVSTALVTHAPCSVLVVRELTTPPAPSQ
jgi:nucleotide-binding universal stress UspA family protein